MNVEKYRSKISNGLRSSVQVPYASVSPADWQPKVADCHANVDRWVCENVGHSAVRGWVTIGTDGGTRTLLTHHSVVRGNDGHLFDITPLNDERIRNTMYFVPHLGSDLDFFRLKDLFQPFLDCETP